MNNKQLAEMIKRLRKEKQEELATTDMNTTSSMKGVAHDVAEKVLKEYQVRSGPTHTLVGTKTPMGRQTHRDRASMPKSGRDVQNRYKLSNVVEKKEVSNTKSTMINTTPEQDSAMVGTQ